MTEHESPTPETMLRTPQPEDALPAPEAPAAAPPEHDAAVLDILVPRRRYAEAAGGYGEAFLAYLDLDLAEPVHGSEVTDFVERYVGHYPDRQGFLRSRLDESDGSAAPAHLTATQAGENEDVVWERMNERYALSEQFGGVHVFRR